jgi:DNA-directed RNA polymerase specialized sigma24 family protein
LENAQLSSRTLAEFYRFALLLTGYPPVAEQMMAETLAELEAHLGDSRKETNRHAWLVTRLRRRCLHNQGANGESTAPRLLRVEGGELLEIEAFILAQHFHQLPEPERSALGLFYIDLFTPEESAQLLEIAVERLAELLSKGRLLLRNSLHATPA